MSKLKRVAARLLSSDAMLLSMRPLLLRGRATILTLHRFAHRDGDPDALSGEALDAALARFKKLGFQFVSLLELVKAIQADKPLPRDALAFTVDDGYFDFAEVAAPIFARHGCPVTVFLITGFIDQQLWPWWDKVEYVASRSRVPGPAPSGHFSVEELKRCDDAVAYERIEELARRNGVPLPVLPPAKYRAMTWDEVRQCEAAGVQFGPHTVSHPILANTTAAHSEREIAGSWRRVREECRSPVPLFAYPNGQPRDFNGRERELLSRSGIAAAVTTSPGHVDKTTPPYDLPRWDLTPDPVRMGQVLSGIEDAKADVRAFLGRLG